MEQSDAGSARRPVLFFDGVCNLCNASVQFVIRHDKGGKVRFASLQSPAGQAAVAVVTAQEGKAPESLIFHDGSRYYTQSDAALRVAAFLDGPWKHLRLLRIFPRGIRNGVYRFVARNRYRLWGKKDACMMPSPALRSRFLEDGVAP